MAKFIGNLIFEGIGRLDFVSDGPDASVEGPAPLRGDRRTPNATGGAAAKAWPRGCPIAGVGNSPTAGGRRRLYDGGMR